MPSYMAPRNQRGDKLIVYSEGNDKNVIPLSSIAQLWIRYRSNGNFRWMRIRMSDGNQVQIDDETEAEQILEEFAHDILITKEI